MSGFLSDELRQRVNRLRDELTRNASQADERIRRLESENVELRNRLSVLTRILISKQIATAEEIATALTEAARAVTAPAIPADAVTGLSPLPISSDSSS
jgi:hypothetical protein